MGHNPDIIFCHESGCVEKIYKSQTQACSQIIESPRIGCEKYFCSSHLTSFDYRGRAINLCYSCAIALKDITFRDIQETNKNLAARLKRVESHALDLRRKARIGRKRTHLALVGLVARLQIRYMKARSDAARQVAFAHFAADLNAVRLQRGLTLAEVGKKAALSPERVLAICHGDWSSSLGDLVSVCMALRVRANMKLIPIGGGPVQIIPLGPKGKRR